MDRERLTIEQIMKDPVYLLDLYYAVAFRANMLETGSQTLSAEDAAKMKKKINPLDENQAEIVKRMRAMQEIFLNERLDSMTTNYRRKNGFTLVEVMVSIVIIGILATLLTSAVLRAVTTAKNAAVATEMGSLETALESFKIEHGAYPPSRIVFAEDGDYSNVNLKDADKIALRQRSLEHLRRFWPRITVRSDGGKPSISGGWYDWNGNHKIDPPYIIEGHECLVMFLGGVPSWGKDGVALMGFSKNPLNPFMSNDPPPTGQAWPSSGNRTNPFEFSASRLTPTDKGLVAYKDIYGGFLVYFSGYSGIGYDPDDVNFTEEGPDGSPGDWLAGFETSQAATPKTFTTKKTVVASPGPNPYTDDESFAGSASGGIDLNSKRHISYLNRLKYQIISAGKDLTYGIGGSYYKGKPIPLPFDPQANKTATNQLLAVDQRVCERDNITNFSAGALD